MKRLVSVSLPVRRRLASKLAKSAGMINAKQKFATI
jgi:hypothetical protein